MDIVRKMYQLIHMNGAGTVVYVKELFETEEEAVSKAEDLFYEGTHKIKDDDEIEWLSQDDMDKLFDRITIDLVYVDRFGVHPFDADPVYEKLVCSNPKKNILIRELEELLDEAERKFCL